MHLDEVNQSEIVLFKKKLEKLSKHKGKGTELITVYIPFGTDRSSVMGQLTEEISQSSNIKSPSTRKNVQGALRKIINFLKQINFKIPKRGLVVFAGNVSVVEGRNDIRLFTIRPINDLKTKLYWCDSKFHLAPLKEMTKPSEIYGLVTIDKNEATIAALVGKKYDILGKFTSGVAGKTRAGGQCLANDTFVQLADGKIIQIKDLHNPLTVTSADLEDFSITNSQIINKWQSKKQAIQITTKFPRMSVESSGDHTFFIFEENEIKERAARELKENDTLLMPEKINTKGKIQKLKTNYFNNYKISDIGIKLLVNTRKGAKLSQKKLGKLSGLHQATISAVEISHFNPRLEFLKNYCKSLKIDHEIFIGNYCSQVSTIVLPEKLGPLVAQIMGYFLGDGNFENERIGFSEQTQEIANFYEKSCRKIFRAKTSLRFREGKNYHQLRVSGKPIVRFIKNEFFSKKSAKETLVPQNILASPNGVLAGFLKGFFDAEGYVTSGRLGLGIINKNLAIQIQLALLRFGIIASVHEYDSNRNPYSDNHRFTIDITEKKSLELFGRFIGFTSKQKEAKLKKLTEKTENRKSKVRQVLVSGKFIRKLFEREGLNTQNFSKVSNFFRDGRSMSKEVFKNSIIGEVKSNKKLFAQFKKILERPLIPVKIKSISKCKKHVPMTDIEVSRQNFLANGILVHNSAKRFEHLREEAAQDFYKRVSEKMNLAFLPYGDKLKGLIIGGPGITKNYFLNRDLLDHRLKKNIISTVDISYTDESGIRELVQRSEEVLRDTDLMKERGAVNDFLEQIAKDELAAYGEKEVNEALKLGKVKELLLSEGIDWGVIKFQCNNCGLQEEKLVKDANYEAGGEKCGKCNGQTELLEDADYLDFMLEKAAETGAELKIISTDTPEGEQFFKGFGGIGAILRYK
ncbi:MAG: peptide chain release factor aRF-1 [Candidatus Diapherotrites archaeon]